MDYKIRAGWNHSKSVKFNFAAVILKKLNYRSKNHLKQKKTGFAKDNVFSEPCRPASWTSERVYQLFYKLGLI